MEVLFCYYLNFGSSCTWPSWLVKLCQLGGKLVHKMNQVTTKKLYAAVKNASYNLGPDWVKITKLKDLEFYLFKNVSDFLSRHFYGLKLVSDCRKLGTSFNLLKNGSQTFDHEGDKKGLLKSNKSLCCCWFDFWFLTLFTNQSKKKTCLIERRKSDFSFIYSISNVYILQAEK